MRTSSQILIFVDVEKAIDAGIKFYLSANGVVLTEGNDRGFLPPEFFARVETANRIPLPGWTGPAGVVKSPSISATSTAAGPDDAGEDGRSVSRGVGPDKKDEASQVSVEELGEKMESTNV